MFSFYYRIMLFFSGLIISICTFILIINGSLDRLLDYYFKGGVINE